MTEAEELKSLRRTVASLIETNVALSRMIAKRATPDDAITHLFGYPLDKILEMIEASADQPLTLPLPAGLYRITWRGEGGQSLAAIGVDERGENWIAPTNWLRADRLRGAIQLNIAKVERIE